MIEELNGDFLQWLRGFYFVVKTGSVRKAAELMRRNPSTISYQLKSLEEELGTVLFDRYKKSLRITPEGKDLFAWTISTFETLQGMRSSVGNLHGELKGHIHMAATLPIVTVSVPVISEFTRKHPKVNLVIERCLTDEVQKSVMDSETDFGMLPLFKKPPEDKFDIIFKARPMLVMHTDNKWNIPPFPDAADLKRLPFVSFVTREGANRLDNYMDSIGLGDLLQKNSVIQINNYHLIMRFVWQKLGVAIMDELCFQASNFGAEWKNLVTRPLDHLLPNSLYGILVRCRKHLSPQAKALADSLRAYFASVSSLDPDNLWQDLRQNDSTPQKENGKNKGRKKTGLITS